MIHFSEIVKQRVVEKLGPRFVFQGCTEEEILKIKEFQNISYVPQVYSDLLRVIGNSGLSDILMGDANWDRLKINKELFAWFAKTSNLAYPNDVLVFYSDLGQLFYFFRTKHQLNDPPVYGYPIDTVGSRLAKLSDSISSFFLSRLEIYAKFIETGREEWRPLAKVYYDPSLDDFCLVGE